MENEETTADGNRARVKISVGEGDVFKQLLHVPEGDYECVMINHGWPEKGLIIGDIILFSEGTAGEAGDIVLIEEAGNVRVGLMAEPGYLETPIGNRPLEAQEHIIGIARGLARRLGRI